MKYYYRIWCDDCFAEDPQGCFDGSYEQGGPFDTYAEALKAGEDHKCDFSQWDFEVVTEADIAREKGGGVRISICRDRGTPLPVYQTDGAAGMDLVANEATLLSVGNWRAVSTGIRVAIPAGHEGQIRPRSGLAARLGITVLNSPGTIDSDYRGEVKVLLMNHGHSPYHVEKGERIAQLVVAPVARVEWEECDSLDETIRGDGGFGHTGA